MRALFSKVVRGSEDMDDVVRVAWEDLVSKQVRII
jgi:hypothetical protein